MKTAKNKIVCFLLLYGLVIPPCTSQSYLSITPSLYEKMVNPGEKIQFKIFLNNHSSVKIQLTGCIRSLNANPEDGEIFFTDNADLDYSCQEWISLVPGEVQIAPSESGEVTVNIRVPQKVEGGYYAAIFFEPVEDENRKSDELVSLSVRMSTIVALQSVQGIRVNAEISSFAHVNGPDRTVFQTRLKNTGNVHVSPDFSVVISTSESRVVDRLHFNESSFVLPGSARIFEVIWKNNRKRSGGQDYLAEYRFQIQGLGQLLKESRSFQIQ